MARIRTIKPEFWEDESIGLLTMGARLLFAACFNLADDEGLLRWTPEYLKAGVFMYDKDVTSEQVDQFMDELATAGMIVPYRAGKSQQKLGWILNFLKHQRINRPQPSKLPPPSLQQMYVKDAYLRRDKAVCHLCRRPIDEAPAGSTDHFSLSLDHVIPHSKGGSDYPSNIKSSHQSCNKAKRDRSVESFKEPFRVANSNLPVSNSVNNSVNNSPPDLEVEVEVELGKGSGSGKESGVTQESFTLDAAVSLVLIEAGLAGKELRTVIHQVIARDIKILRVDPKNCAEAMVAAWQKYDAMDLSFKYGPEKFFGTGIWRKTEKEWRGSQAQSGPQNIDDKYIPESLKRKRDLEARKAAGL